MAPYSGKFDLKQEKALKDKLTQDGFVFSDVNYAFWQAKGAGVNAVLYTSGKLVVQGKQVEEFTAKYLGIQQQLALSIPKTTTPQDACRIGTDESGKGDYFGPLVIAGVLADESNFQKLLDIGVKDSKKLNDVVIAKMAAEIKNNCVHSIVKINPEKYNELYAKFNNLNKLLAWGHARVIENILEKKPCKNAISDQFGDESLILNALLKKGREIKLEQRHRAEDDLAVAAASIIARDEFVKAIKKFSQDYNLNIPKGCNDMVLQQAKAFVQTHGKQNLNKVVKLHFKTTNQII